MLSVNILKCYFISEIDSSVASVGPGHEASNDVLVYLALQIRGNTTYVEK